MAVRKSAPRVSENGRVSGTGDVTLRGAYSEVHLSFSQAFSPGDSVPYTIVGGGKEEVGDGTYLNETTFRRDVVWSTSDNPQNSTASTGVAKVTFDEATDVTIFNAPHPWSILQTNTDGSLANASPFRKTVSLDTIVALKAQEGMADGDAVKVLETNRWYQWDAENATSADNENTFEATAYDVGLWIGIGDAVGTLNVDASASAGGEIKVYSAKKASNPNKWFRWLADAANSVFKVTARLNQASEVDYLSLFSLGTNADRLQVHHPLVTPSRTDTKGWKSGSMGRVSSGALMVATADAADASTAAAAKEIAAKAGTYLLGEYELISDLKAIDAAKYASDNQRALVLGSADGGDVPAFYVEWFPASSASADDANVFRPSVGAAASGNGRWIRVAAAIDVTFSSGDATPSVKNGSWFITSGTTTITDFDDGYEGQAITIQRGASDIVIAHDPAKINTGGINRTLSVGAPVAVFRSVGGVWYCINAAAELLDEDDFASDSATKAPTQRSTKAYITALADYNRGTPADFSAASAAFLATTTATGSTTPNIGQKALFIAPGLPSAGSNVLIAATGTGQSYFGYGNSSVLQNASLQWTDHVYGSVKDIYLTGTSDYGLQLTGTAGKGVSYFIGSNLLIRSKTTAGIDLAGKVLNCQFSNVTAIGNGYGLRVIGDGSGNNPGNLDFVNFQAINNTSAGGYMEGCGEVKVVNSRFQSLAGPAFKIKGTTARVSVENYLLHNNYNQGSATDDIEITSISPYNSGTQIQVVTATDHKMVAGYLNVSIESANYSATTSGGAPAYWSVAQVINSTTMILSRIGTNLPAPTYTVTESGIFHRFYPGLDLDADNLGNINDLWNIGGANNFLKVKNVFNYTAIDRGGGSKQMVWLEGSNNRIWLVGSRRGRNVSPFSDVMPSGPASHTGNAMTGVFDPTSALAPGGMMTGTMAPYAAGGVAANNQPAGYAYSLVSESSVWAGVSAYSDLTNLATVEAWQWTRTNLSTGIYATSPGAIRLTSDKLAQGVSIIGAAAGSVPIVMPYGTDTNIPLELSGKGSASSVRLTSGDRNNMIEVRGGADGGRPFVRAYGRSDTNVPMGYDTQGNGAHDFFIGGVQHFKIAHTSGATSYPSVQAGTTTVSFGAGGGTNIAVDFLSAGTGIVALRPAGGTRQVQASTTGIGFYGTSPVARPTVGAALSTGGAETNTNLATRINDIRTALVDLGLVV